MDTVNKIISDAYTEKYKTRTKVFLKLLKHMVRTMGKDTVESFIGEHIEEYQN